MKSVIAVLVLSLVLVNFTQAAKDDRWKACRMKCYTESKLCMNNDSKCFDSQSCNSCIQQVYSPCFNRCQEMLRRREAFKRMFAFDEEN
uniref:Protein Aeq5-like1 n=1 Tax=Nematostella vectensis TaxID=45351 RepID=AEQL1_NEMVE|nr:RecName: Full=Protein Aeq5-like1; Flags: Precursor [Nematostella vectensis]